MLSNTEGIHFSKAKSHTADHFPAWLENTIIVIIILVVIHTVIDDLSFVLHWSHDTRTAIIIASFVFDLFFSVEFIARSLITARRGMFMDYIKYQRGWVDLLSSLPLLLLVSGPELALRLFVPNTEEAMGMFAALSVLKTAKAIRVTRILRLLRVIKLFGKIQNTESVMTGKHVGSIATICVVALIMVFAIVEFVPGLRFGNYGDYYEHRKAELSSLMTVPDTVRRPDKAWLVAHIEADPVSGGKNGDVIRVQDKAGNIVYENPFSDELRYSAFNVRAFPLVDIGGGYKVLLSHHRADAVHAQMNLIILIAILFIIGALLFVYTGMFARQIADPVFIMDRGLREMEYNLEVKLDAHSANDEVFRLARAYNVRWLPLKNQIVSYRKQKEGVKSSLSMDDLF